ncbi:AAA family ATPase [Capilliphycus salinus ALCB114379]|uniref:AAA family ATPase n=1 Tax=Capilliphycus salinus TaxID=2768948 RepID=UPI0039A627BA
MNEPLEYTGKYQPTPAEIEQQGIYPYLPSGDLIEAVNLAIAQQRPLLLEGEAGCGKTGLAVAIAYEFTQKYLKGTTRQWPYFFWKITSETRLQDGFYRYNCIKLFRENQLFESLNSLEKSIDPLELEQRINRLKESRSYREWGPLAEAFQQEDYRPIVLIDGIDKAQIDFSRDLPLEFDEMVYKVKETGEIIEAKNKPIIIITHNNKTPLADDVLRKCFYFYVEFPDEERLEEIIQLRFPKLNRSQNQLIENAIACCLEMREIIQERPEGRPPGTGEVIEFIGALLQKPVKQAQISLENLPEQIALLGTLIKSKEDRVFYQNYE